MSYSAFLGPVLAILAGLAGKDDLADPKVAQPIAQQFWEGIDRVGDMQLRFHSTMRSSGRAVTEHGLKWEKGFYAFKRGGYELLRYEETNYRKGVAQGPALWTYALTPDSLQGWREDPQLGMRHGAIRQATEASVLNFRLPWTPDNFLRVAFLHSKMI